MISTGSKCLVIVVFIGMCILYSTQSQAISPRVELLPNGEVNACANCHTDAMGGGELNPFGQSVDELLDFFSTDPFWDEALAMQDADGDGFTNGEELQDPEGTWSAGDEAPGDPTLVTNPGDPEDAPVTSVVDWKMY